MSNHAIIAFVLVVSLEKRTISKLARWFCTAFILHLLLNLFCTGFANLVTMLTSKFRRVYDPLLSFWHSCSESLRLFSKFSIFCLSISVPQAEAPAEIFSGGGQATYPLSTGLIKTSHLQPGFC